MNPRLFFAAFLAFAWSSLAADLQEVARFPNQQVTGVGISEKWGRIFVNFPYWSADHSSNAPFSVPLLVLDMYEHAYQMDYGAAAAKYVDAFMQNVNWDEINRRVESLK